MGNLTDDMTRLRGEVDALRSDREALMQDLTRGAGDLTTAVAAMRADFTSAHAAMAKQTRGEREAFVAAVIDEVSSLLDAFARDRYDMARKGRFDRGVFLSEMRRQVAGMCKDTADDMMGARRAWHGKSPGKSRHVPMKKRAAAPEIKAEKLSNLNKPAPVSVPVPPFQKSKEKSRPNATPKKTTTKGKWGRK